jgi:hypothetical protein
MDFGFQQGFGSLRVQRVSIMLLHGEACPMTASKPEQPTRKNSFDGAEEEKRSRSLARPQIHQESLPAALCANLRAPSV